MRTRPLPPRCLTCKGEPDAKGRLRHKPGCATYVHERLLSYESVAAAAKAAGMTPPIDRLHHHHPIYRALQAAAGIALAPERGGQ